MSAKGLATQFRAQATPVIGRTQDGRFWMDVRTVGDKELGWIVEAARNVKREM